MSVLLFLLVFVPLSLVLAWWLAERDDRALMIRRTAIVWIVLAPLTAAMNEWMPFAGGGDDEGYYELAEPPPTNLAEALDFSRFHGFMSQPGYPLLLSLLNAAVGHDLLAYKLLNLFFFITLSIVWYRIGFVLEGRRFARVASLAILVLTPLWYYVFFLLKDMLITLLQSLFLLGVTQIWSTARARAIVLISLTSAVMIPLRSALLLQQAAVLAGSVLASLGRRSRRSRTLLAPALLIILAGLTLAAVSNRELLGGLGVQDETRTASVAMLEHAATYEHEGVVGGPLFFVVYIFSETSGMSPSAWGLPTASLARGALAVPWIIFGVPCFLLGMRYLLLEPAVRASPLQRPTAWINRLRSSKAAASPWAIVLLFAVSYLAISWTVGDTTRWRVPDLPMLATVAAAGWTSSAITLRREFVIAWLLVIGSLFGGLHLLRSL